MVHVQDLIFKNGRLYCPTHPKQTLEEGMTDSEHGPFTVVCTAQLEAGNCMKSAQWPTKAAYERAMSELKAANEYDRARPEQLQPPRPAPSGPSKPDPNRMSQTFETKTKT
jgi:hypothetical protein